MLWLKNIQTKAIQQTADKLHKLSDLLHRSSSNKLTKQEGELQDRFFSIRIGSTQYFDRQRQEIEHIIQNLSFRATQNLQETHVSFIKVHDQLERSTEKLLQKQEESLELLTQKLKGRDPRPWLKSGWTQLQSPSKRVVSIKDINLGETLLASLIDGTLTVTVTDKNKKIQKGKA